MRLLRGPDPDPAARHPLQPAGRAVVARSPDLAYSAPLATLLERYISGEIEGEQARSAIRTHTGRIQDDHGALTRRLRQAKGLARDFHGNAVPEGERGWPIRHLQWRLRHAPELSGFSSPEATSETAPIHPKVEIALPGTPRRLPPMRARGVTILGEYALDGSLNGLRGEAVPGQTLVANKGQFKSEATAAFGEAIDSSLDVSVEWSEGEFALKVKDEKIPLSASVKGPNILELQCQPQPIQFEQDGWSFTGSLAFRLKLEIVPDLVPDWTVEPALHTLIEGVAAVGMAASIAAAIGWALGKVAQGVRIGVYAGAGVVLIVVDPTATGGVPGVTEPDVTA